jgi:hypothetical protein
VAVRLAVAVLALVVAPAANAKLNPRFARTVAEAGERVTVELGYVDAYLPPLEVSLVRIRDEPFVRSRRDRRLVPVGLLPRDQEGPGLGRLSFVASVPPGRYTLAVWFRGTETGRWQNATSGLWRGSRRIVVRVVG